MIVFRRVLTLLFVILVLCLVSTTSAQTIIPPKPTHIIVMSLDGARPDAILQSETPNIQALAARGAVSWEAQTVYPSVTTPAHVSMLTGLDVREHGVIWNAALPGFQLTIPTFLSRAQEAGYRVAIVAGKTRFDQLFDGEFALSTVGDRGVVDLALDYLHSGYEVLFIHFPNPDYFGHLTGWMSETYLFELRNTDSQVGRVLDAVEALDLTDETLIILTADHGGHDKTHGSALPEDMRIPWMVAGPGVLPGQTLEIDVHTSATAATVLWTLGLTAPESTVARPVFEAFVSR